MRKIAFALLLAVAAVVGVVLTRTMMLPRPGAGAPALGVDATGAEALRMAERLGAAIRFETISRDAGAPADPAVFAALHAFLAQSYPAAHAAMTREAIGSSLLYRWPGADASKTPVAFLAHMDVVPVEPGTETGWTHPPFAGVVADGAIWGRGALDDKATVIALLEAAERLAASGFRPDRDVYFLFGHDEEIGGVDGAAKLAATLEARGVRLAWTLDEGSAVVDGVIPGARRPIALIATGEKGYVSLRLTATAPGGHSSAPGPDTAVSLLARAVVRLADHPYPIELDADTIAFLHAVAPELPFPMRAALANLWLTGPIVKAQLARDATVAAAMRTTTAPTMIAGGTKDNVLPQTATAVVNYRIHPRDDAAGVKARAERLIADPRITVEALQPNDASPRSSTTSEGYAALVAATRATFGPLPAAPSLVIGATDSRHYTRIADDLYRFTPVTFETSDLRRIHGTDERLTIENLVRASAWYEDVMRRTAGG